MFLSGASGRSTDREKKKERPVPESKVTSLALLGYGQRPEARSAGHNRPGDETAVLVAPAPECESDKVLGATDLFVQPHLGRDRASITATIPDHIAERTGASIGPMSESCSSSGFGPRLATSQRALPIKGHSQAPANLSICRIRSTTMLGARIPAFVPTALQWLVAKQVLRGPLLA